MQVWADVNNDIVWTEIRLSLGSIGLLKCNKYVGIIDTAFRKNINYLS